MRLDLGHFASIRLPARTFDPAASGSWVTEGQPIPVRSLDVTASSVYPRKLAVITSWSEELARAASNIEQVASALISEAAAQAFDAAVLGSQADDGAIAQGILNNVTPTAAAGRLGSDLDTATQDIANLAAKLASVGAGLDPVVVAAVPQATALKMLVAGKGWDIPVLPSAALAAGTVVMLEAGSFASAFSGTPDFSTADVALLHYESASPSDITGGTPSPAVPTRSLMQTNGIALRMVLRCAYGMRNRAHVAYLTGANWP
jgi:Phage capsid family